MILALLTALYHQNMKFDLLWGNDIILQNENTPEKIVEEKGLKQVTDTGAIEKIIDDIIASNPDNVAAYKGGKVNLMGWFVGQVMKASHGKANPGVVNSILKQKLG